VRYAPEALHREIAYIAYHLGWQRQELLDLEHLERRTWVAQIERLVATSRQDH
jgi:hypothetical protein